MTWPCDGGLCLHIHHWVTGWELGALEALSQSLILWMFSFTMRWCQILMNEVNEERDEEKMMNFQGRPLDVLLLQSTKGKVITRWTKYRPNCNYLEFSNEWLSSSEILTTMPSTKILNWTLHLAFHSYWLLSCKTLTSNDFKSNWTLLGKFKTFYIYTFIRHQYILSMTIIIKPGSVCFAELKFQVPLIDGYITVESPAPDYDPV